jgi:hypothetical protein
MAYTQCELKNLKTDSMNMTARIETSGAKNRVHLSSDTADLLRKAGLEHWTMEREDKVSLKGRGTNITTYWLNQGAIASSYVASRCSSTDAPTFSVANPEVPLKHPGLKLMDEDEDEEAHASMIKNDGAIPDENQVNNDVED